MEIKKEVREILTDDNGNEIKKGMTLLYRQKTTADTVGVYDHLEDGLLIMNSPTDSKEYKLRPTSLTACRIIKNIEFI